MKDSQREPGIITAVTSGKNDDHRFETSWLYISFKGSSQGFGGIVLDEGLRYSYERMLCETFDVQLPDDLKGEECYALRCWGRYSRRWSHPARPGQTPWPPIQPPSAGFSYRASRYTA